MGVIHLSDTFVSFKPHFNITGISKRTFSNLNSDLTQIKPHSTVRKHIFYHNLLSTHVPIKIIPFSNLKGDVSFNTFSNSKYYFRLALNS